MARPVTTRVAQLGSRRPSPAGLRRARGARDGAGSHCRPAPGLPAASWSASAAGLAGRPRSRRGPGRTRRPVPVAWRRRPAPGGARRAIRSPAADGCPVSRAASAGRRRSTSDHTSRSSPGRARSAGEVDRGAHLDDFSGRLVRPSGRVSLIGPVIGLRLLGPIGERASVFAHRILRGVGPLEGQRPSGGAVRGPIRRPPAHAGTARGPPLREFVVVPVRHTHPL